MAAGPAPGAGQDPPPRGGPRRPAPGPSAPKSSGRRRESSPSAAGRPGSARSAPGQPLPGQPLPGQPLPGQPLPGQPLPGQPLPGSPDQRRKPSSPAPHRSGLSRPASGRPVSGRPVSGRPCPASLVRATVVPALLPVRRAIPQIPAVRRVRGGRGTSWLMRMIWRRRGGPIRRVSRWMSRRSGRRGRPAFPRRCWAQGSGPGPGAGPGARTIIWSRSGFGSGDDLDELAPGPALAGLADTAAGPAGSRAWMMMS